MPPRRRNKPDPNINRRSAVKNLEPSLKEVEEREGEKVSTHENFTKGTPVEVSSDEEGFNGAWFAATIVEAVGEDKFLIEYQSLRTEDDSAFLREEIDTLPLQPCLPETVVDHFRG